jgi:hypothetical protein
MIFALTHWTRPSWRGVFKVNANLSGVTSALVCHVKTLHASTTDVTNTPFQTGARVRNFPNLWQLLAMLGFASPVNVKETRNAGQMTIVPRSNAFRPHVVNGVCVGHATLPGTSCQMSTGGNGHCFNYTCNPTTNFVIPRPISYE